MKFVFIFLLLFGCSSKEMKQYDQIMEASCGQCMFAMDEQMGCDLAVRIDTKAFFVEGAAIQRILDAALLSDTEQRAVSIPEILV